jgi:hypothetical protein
MAATKHALRALARRLDLDREVHLHDAELARLAQEDAPELRAELLIVAPDNPRRIRSDAAFAALCGGRAAPGAVGTNHATPAQPRGHRQANAALYRVVIVRMRWHQPTIAYVRRRVAEGKTKAEIIRCLKRYVAREVFRLLVH